eukprot:gb/GECG01005253.1/.p1 GENE.gb/GECG01005253.1/~~gb/GECG01005253.1/.p1  ORF type:complete len:487 (+),score=31.96 gb/GECG01005253.1/:1-1461(+)
MRPPAGMDPRQALTRLLGAILLVSCAFPDAYAFHGLQGSATRTSAKRTGGKELGYCGKAHEIPARPPTSQYTLEQVQVFIRHGDRVQDGPGPCWPNDDTVFNCNLTQLLETTTSRERDQDTVPWLYRKIYRRGHCALPGNCHVGQLTTKGFEQHTQNGKYLAAAYGDLLGKITDHDQFHLRSDDMQRTIMSGQALFDSMVAAAHRNLSFSATELESVGWYTSDTGFDDIVASTHLCPEYQNVVNKAVNSPKFQEHVDKVTRPLAKTVAQLFNIKTSEVDLGQMFDCLYVRTCDGHSIPSVINDTIFNDIVNENTWERDYIYNYPGAGKTIVGLLVGDAVANIHELINGSRSRRFALFSGHDTGPMMPLLAAFDVWDGAWTPYASLISWELYSKTGSPRQSTGDYALRFVYNGKTMKVPGCSSDICALDEFLTVAEDLIPTPKECGLSESTGDMQTSSEPPVLSGDGYRVRWVNEAGALSPRLIVQE